MLKGEGQLPRGRGGHVSRPCRGPRLARWACDDGQHAAILDGLRPPVDDLLVGEVAYRGIRDDVQ